MTSPDRDILISRVVDGTALDHDWAALEAIGQKDPALWRELALSQRQHAALSSVVHAAGRVADDVDLEIPEAHVIGRISGVARWGGWAVAAAVALAWFGGLRSDRSDMNKASPIPGILSPSSASDDPGDALQRYLDLGKQRGTVLGEMPAKVVIQAAPAEDNSGRMDVIYLRQIVERARVDDLHRVPSPSDELGRPAGPARLMARPASSPY